VKHPRVLLVKRQSLLTRRQVFNLIRRKIYQYLLGIITSSKDPEKITEDLEKITEDLEKITEDLEKITEDLDLELPELLQIRPQG
jgi:predicted DNA-binding transcriptional regulator